MKKYLIKLDYEEEINAESKEDAIIQFFDQIIYDTQSDPASWLESQLMVKKIEEKIGKIVIANINIEIPTDAKTHDEAIMEAENYELPPEYVEDSFEIVKVIDNN